VQSIRQLVPQRLLFINAMASLVIVKMRQTAALLGD
jgi:hypothetical protein